MSTEVLVFGVNEVRGGVETYMYHLVRAMSNKGLHFTFAGRTDHPAYYKQLQSMGSSFVRLPSPQRNPFTYARAISDLLSQYHFDVVYENKFTNANVFPLLCAKKAGVKRIIVHAHNSGFSGNPLEDLLHVLLRPLTAKYATDRFACSSVAAAHMFGKRTPFVFVPNSIDVKEFEFVNATRLKVRQRLGIARNTVCIGHVGNFYRQKNHSRLIRIFAHYHKINDQSVLLLVGNGDEQETQRLHQLCHELGVSDSVIFYGKSNHTANLYNAMDVFLFPSLYEGLGMVLIEAQANGLPCVVSSTVPSEANCRIHVPYICCDLKASDRQWEEAIEESLRSHANRESSGSRLEHSYWDLSRFDRLMPKLLRSMN